MALHYIEPFILKTFPVLPTQFDDSLSYYEAVNKVVIKLNEGLAAINSQNDQLTEWHSEIYTNIGEWEQDVLDALNSWKNDTEDDITQWKNDTLADFNQWLSQTLTALNEWKEARDEEYDELAQRTEEAIEIAETSANAAANSATSASTSATAAAESAQDAADSAATVAAEAIQIETNTNDIHDSQAQLINFANTQILYREYTLENGGLNSNGEEISGSTYMRFRDYITTNEAANIIFNDKGASTNYALYACYYNFVNGEYVFQSPRVSTTTGYQIDTNFEYVRLSFYNANGSNETLFRSWISWIISDATNARFLALEGKIGGFITKDSNGTTVEMGKARYTIKRVTDAAINVDTYRLYKGEIIGDSALTMWENSDAEGVIRLVDEEDYIGGFHGDEVYQSVKAFIDGNEISISNFFSRRHFNTFALYVYSKVYHAGTTATDSNLAFYRYKELRFENEKVTISNNWIAANDVNVLQAPLMLFQCNKLDSNNNICFTNYSIDSDYKLYSTSDASNYPSQNNVAKKAIYTTKFGVIEINVEQIDSNYQNDYRCVTMANFLTSQNRLKTYFNTIREKSAGTTITEGQNIIARFSFSVK